MRPWRGPGEEGGNAAGGDLRDTVGFKGIRQGPSACRRPGGARRLPGPSRSPQRPPPPNSPTISFLDGPGFWVGFFFLFLPALFSFVTVWFFFQADSHVLSAHLLGFPLFWLSCFHCCRSGSSCLRLRVSITSRKPAFKEISIESLPFFLLSAAELVWSGFELRLLLFAHVLGVSDIQERR